jgi:hypothetical protein
MPMPEPMDRTEFLTQLKQHGNYVEFPPYSELWAPAPDIVATNMGLLISPEERIPLRHPIRGVPSTDGRAPPRCDVVPRHGHGTAESGGLGSGARRCARLTREKLTFKWPLSDDALSTGPAQ